MTNVTCQKCDELINRINKLQRENERLRQVILNTLMLANTIAGNADYVLSQHQPRGTWSYATGAKKTADVISEKLGGVI